MKNNFHEFHQDIMRFCDQIKEDNCVCAEKYKEFYKLNRRTLEKANNNWERIEEKKEKNIYVNEVREELSKYFFQSKFFRYSYEKPQGYPGDFRMMEFIYNGRLDSETTLGKYYDQFYLDNPYAEAVRCRKDKMVEITRDLYLQIEECRVLNIACGPSREVKDLFEMENSLRCKVEMLAIDHDEAALEFSRNSLKGNNVNINIHFKREDVFKFFKKPDLGRAQLGDFDIVYSTGLADYLPDLLLSRMVFFSFEVLKKGGKFILAHKIEEQDGFAPITPRFICDWHFHKRSEDDLDHIIKRSNIQGYNVANEFWDRSKRIKFLIVEKVE